MRDVSGSDRQTPTGRYSRISSGDDPPLGVCDSCDGVSGTDGAVGNLSSARGNSTFPVAAVAAGEQVSFTSVGFPSYQERSQILKNRNRAGC